MWPKSQVIYPSRFLECLAILTGMTTHHFRHFFPGVLPCSLIPKGLRIYLSEARETPYCLLDELLLRSHFLYLSKAPRGRSSILTCAPHGKIFIGRLFRRIAHHYAQIEPGSIHTYIRIAVRCNAFQPSHNIHNYATQRDERPSVIL